MFALTKLRAESGDLQHLDLLRVLAALGIMVFHFAVRLPGSPTISGLPLLVDAFFVISGIVIAHVYTDRIKDRDDYARFLVKRFARLAPLHYATLLVYIALAVAFSLNGPRYDFRGIADNLAFTHAFACDARTFNHVSWSLSAEMFAYLCAPALLWLGPYALTLGAVLLTVFVHAELGWWTWTYDLGWLRCLPAFAIGMGLYSVRDFIATFVPRGTLVVSCMLFVICIAGGQGGLPVYAIVLLVVASALAADTRAEVSRLVRLAAPWGQLTFGIYMLHPLYDTIVIGAVEHAYPVVSGELRWLLVLAGFPIVVAAAYVSFYAFETPARRFLVRALSRRPRLSIEGEQFRSAA